jgi:hypothetical protein
MSHEYEITFKKVKNDYCYSVSWSPFYRMEKYILKNYVPAEAGLFQVFKKDGNGLDLIVVDIAYYGGVRGMMRELIDPLCPRSYPFRDIMMNEECYIRFSLNPQQVHLQNVLTYYKGTEPKLDEGEEIFVNEIENMTIRRETEEELKHNQNHKESEQDFFVGARLNRL